MPEESAGRPPTSRLPSTRGTNSERPGASTAGSSRRNPQREAGPRDGTETRRFLEFCSRWFQRRLNSFQLQRYSVQSPEELLFDW